MTMNKLEKKKEEMPTCSLILKIYTKLNILVKIVIKRYFHLMLILIVYQMMLILIDSYISYRFLYFNLENVTNKNDLSRIRENNNIENTIT